MLNQPANRTAEEIAVAHSYFPSVCSIAGKNKRFGTGFLIGPDIIITNHHVYEEIKRRGSINCKVYFIGLGKEEREVNFSRDYHIVSSPPMPSDFNDENRKAEIKRKFSALSPDSMLDYAILRLSENVGGETTLVYTPFNTAPITKRTWFCLFGKDAMCEDIEAGDGIFILHKPGTALKFEFTNTSVDRLNEIGNRLFYWFESAEEGTQDGSSGAFCFSTRTGRVVALHQSHQSTSGIQAEKRGIPITRIIKDVMGKLTIDQIRLLSVSPPKRSDEDCIPELVNLILAHKGGDLNDSKIYRAYLDALLPGLPLEVQASEDNQLYKIIAHLNGLVKKNENCPLLDFFSAIKLRWDRDLLDFVDISKHIEKLVTKGEINDFSVATAFSTARIKKNLKHPEKRKIKIYVDIFKEESEFFTSTVEIQLMSKPPMRLSDIGDFSNIRKPNDFIKMFRDLWFGKIVNYLIAVDPDMIEVVIGVDGKTFDWEIEKKLIRKDNKDTGFTIGERFSSFYRSIERQQHMDMLRKNLSSEYHAMALGMDGLNVLGGSLKHKNELLSELVKERKIIGVYSFKKLKKPEKQMIYYSILHKGIPFFVWGTSNGDNFSEASLKNISSLDGFRVWLSENQQEVGKSLGVLFDIPDEF